MKLIDISFVYCLLCIQYAIASGGITNKQDRLPRIKERACAITRAQCCMDCCVVNELGYKKGYNLTLSCMLGREEMTREENKNDLRATIQVGASKYNINYIYSLLYF